MLKTFLSCVLPRVLREVLSNVPLPTVEDACTFCEEEFDPASSANIVAKSRRGEWGPFWRDVVIRGVGMWLACRPDLSTSWKDMRWYNPESSGVSSDMCEEAKKTEGIAFEMLFSKTSVDFEDEFWTSDGLVGKGVSVLDGDCGREAWLVLKTLFIPRLSDFETESLERCPVTRKQRNIVKAFETLRDHFRRVDMTNCEIYRIWDIGSNWVNI